MADRQIKASPLTFRVTIQKQGADGQLYQEQVLPDQQTIVALRDQFTGNEQGLKELSRLLDARQRELEDKIQELRQQDEERQKVTK